MENTLVNKRDQDPLLWEPCWNWGQLGLPACDVTWMLGQLRPARQSGGAGRVVFQPLHLFYGYEKKGPRIASWVHGQVQPGLLLLTWSKRLPKELADVHHAGENSLVFLLEAAPSDTLLCMKADETPGSCPQKSF